MEPGVNLAVRAGQVFTPSAPIDKGALFAGRKKQIRQVVDTINQRGQHAIIFGERGVGKTSLANVLSENLSVPGGELLMPHINCDTGDDFTSLWTKIFTEIKFARRGKAAGFDSGDIWDPQDLLKGLTSDTITTGDIRRLLTPLIPNFLVVIIIDEFDRLPDGSVRTMLADAIKMLSDRSIGITLVLVGVADSVEELIAEHQSIERNLVQVPMPRMSATELSDIINKGLSLLQMSIDPDALSRITLLSRGLPHYTHLLARFAARNAIDEGLVRISRLHVELAIGQAVNEAQSTTSRAYHKATSSQRRDALYRPVLLACSLARTDDLGYFAPADVRGPLNHIIRNKSYDIPKFNRTIKDFCKRERGAILEKEGVSHRYRYRFSDAMMQPFVIMKGFTDGSLTEDVLLGLFRDAAS